jgi:hypothetical protein
MLHHQMVVDLFHCRMTSLTGWFLISQHYILVIGIGTLMCFWIPQSVLLQHQGTLYPDRKRITLIYSISWQYIHAIYVDFLGQTDKVTPNYNFYSNIPLNSVWLFSASCLSQCLSCLFKIGSIPPHFLHLGFICSFIHFWIFFLKLVIC